MHRKFYICVFLSLISICLLSTLTREGGLQRFFRPGFTLHRRHFNIQRWIDRGLVDVRAVEFLEEMKKGVQYIHTYDRSLDFENIKYKAEFHDRFQSILRFDGSECFNQCFDSINSVSCEHNFSSSHKSEIPYHIVHIKTPIIQTFAVNNTIPCSVVPIGLAVGVISHFNYNSSVFLRNAFWGLLLPKNNNRIPCYHWHNYWVFRLLWEINGSLGFYPNSLNVSVPSEPKNQEFKNIRNILRNFTCPTNQTFFECIKVWTLVLSNHFQCNPNIEEIVMDWLQDLTDLGYKELERATTINYVKNYSNDPSSSDFGVPVIFNPPEQYLLDSKDHKGLREAKINQIKEIVSLCGDKYPFTVKSNKIAKTIMRNIVLLIVFNHPHYEVLPFLENLYGAIFSHRVYCGANISEFTKTGYHRNVSFIEINTEHGFDNYLCISYAMKMNYDVEGYLFLGDDVLLNTAQLSRLPLDKIWMVHFSVLRRSVLYDAWGNWMKSFGRPAFMKAWAELEYLSHSSKAIASSFGEFKKKLEKDTGFSDGLQSSAVDIYYIPSRYKEDIIFYFDVFARHGVFLEIAVPTVLSGLCSHKDFHFISGVYLWTQESKKNYERHFDNKILFIHPFKHRLELKNVKGMKFLCQRYFPTILQ